MVNFGLVSKIIGQLLCLESFLMLWCVVMSYAYGEDDSIAFLMSMVLTLTGGMLFLYCGRNAGSNMSRRDAYLIVTSTWVIFSVFGMLPYMIGGYITNLTDAYFETMSGFTTTGASIVNDVEKLPHGILFWRSLSQWIGGLGIVFFTIAILPSMGGGSVRVYAAEATGPIRTKMHPKLSTNAKWIWTIYLALTIACVLSLWACGINWFDSVNYGMTTTATGGFSTHNDSTAFFINPGVEYVSALFQFLAGINFTLLYLTLFKMRWRDLFKNSEFKVYLGLVIIATIWIACLLVSSLGYDVEHALRSALFQVVSFMTTTGMFSDNVDAWPHITWVIIGGLMLIGASAGSTSGGFKCVRGLMVFEVMRNEFRRILHPNAVLPVKVSGQPVPQSKLTTLMAFFAIYISICLICAIIMMAAGVDNVNAVGISLGLISNVGPALDQEIGASMTWSQLPDYVKWVCSFLMLVGRLEIMNVLVLFTRSYWKDN